ncbi:MAG TPA: dTDP-4-dehydrorhamnose 3,5-epimerase [Acidimicrobiales bacterium]|nr:dTDP-4-dehydrorhamnose 3,5-epimerase [Acidimicrobiales bacterium]
MAELVEFEAQPSAIEGLHVLTMKQVTDDRGTVREFFRESAFEAAGLKLGRFLQVNVTETRRGGVRGMHAEAMTKLVAVVSGRVLGAWVDLRPPSPTHGAVVARTLGPGDQVLVPAGVGNGFQALEDGTQYLYCFDDEWTPTMAGLACTPLDPALGIEWPIPIDRDDRAQISQKDLDAPLFADLPGSPS